MNLDNCGYKPWKLVIAKERKTQRMKRERERDELQFWRDLGRTCERENRLFYLTDRKRERGQNGRESCRL